MKHFTNQSYESHVGRMNYGGAKFCRFALFPLMLLMLLLLPANMVAQTDYDTSVTFTALAGSPEGYNNEKYHNLVDGKKEPNNFSKWCCKFNGSAYVFFEASKAGVPWVTPSQRVMTMQILDVEVAIRCHGSSMATMKAKKANGCLSRR